jgi:hypothetical protein
MKLAEFFKGAISQGSENKPHAARSGGGAHLVFSNGLSNMECAVLDYSYRGAKLQPTDLDAVPKFFELHLAGGGAFLCELTHRKSDHIVVRFIPNNI